MAKSLTTLNHIESVCGDLQKLAGADGHGMLAHLLSMVRLEAREASHGGRSAMKKPSSKDMRPAGRRYGSAVSALQR